MSSEERTKLLVVEDDLEIANALASYGEARGYEILVANDGPTAVTLGMTERPGVILLDIMLPGMDGRDVMLKLKEAGVTKGAVVIFVTARESQDDRLVGLGLGADDYETKPFHFNLLFQKIEHLLRKKSSGEI